MTVLYFGRPWSAALGADDTQQVPTPIGQACMTCAEPIGDSDRGFMRMIMRNAGILDAHEVAPVHVECEALGTVGHLLGVCSCTGYDITARSSALLLWDRLARAPGSHADE